MASAEGIATTAIFDATHKCAELIDQITVKYDESILTHSFVPDDVGSSSNHENNKHSFRDFMGLYNSFWFWRDYTGALSLLDSSLDTRLRDLPDVSVMVTDLLDMVLRNLQQLNETPKTTSLKPIDQADPDPEKLPSIIRWERFAKGVDFALNRLHYLGAVIRRGSAEKLQDSLTTFLSESDILFHKYAVLLVHRRFPSARRGLCQQLGGYIAVRRQMLFQKHHHAKKLTVRRVLAKSPLAQQELSLEAESDTVTNFSPGQRMVGQLNVPTSGITEASRPDPHASALRQIHLPKRPAPTSLISTVSVSQIDPFEYPPRPTANLCEGKVQCPYCLMSLDNIKLQNHGDEYWRHHVDEDLKPYSCLFPECAEDLLFFTSCEEWKSHMALTHSRDWPQKVHAVIWYCDIDHDPPELFDTEWEWRRHMKDLSSHPKRNLPPPSTAQLDGMMPRKKKRALRDRFVCPLCEQIPHQIRDLVEKARDQMPDMDEVLFDHIAKHIKSLSLMSLPRLDIAGASPRENQQSVSIKNSYNKSLNEGSIPKPPSGIDYLRDISLPSVAWSTRGRGSHAPLTAPDPGVAWDTENSDYKHPDIPPEQLADEWLEVWATWKKGNDQSSCAAQESDPILARLIKSQKAHYESRTWSSDLELKDGSGRTMLSFAAERGEVALVKSLLSQAVDIETTDQTGRTPLLWAAACGKAEVVKLLIESGAEIEAIDQEYGRTPFSWAAARGHMAVIEVLLTRGACVDTTDNSGRNPFKLAAPKGDADILNLLLAASAHIDTYNHRHDQETLSWAAAIGDESIVRDLLDIGTNIETRDKEHHQTPLSWAAAEGHESVVELLLEKGSEIETRDKKHGRTPLSLAAKGGHISVVMLLLKKGSDIEARDRKYGRTPLSWAAKNGHISVVDALVEYGANIEASDKDHDQTPISFAAENGHEDVVELLIKKGADVHAADRDGRTARSRAAEKGHEAIVKLLTLDCDKSP